MCTGRGVLLMRVGALLSLAAVCTLAVNDAVRMRQNDHWFCHSLDCPEYTVLKSIDDDLELREYGDYLWVSTNISQSSYDYAVRLAFIRLLQYISGDNEEGWRLDMTAPVRTRLDLGSSRTGRETTFTVSFFLPYEFQTGRRRPPAPSRSSVFIESTLSHRYWVKAYAGFTSESRVLELATDVMNRLDSLGELYRASSLYTASYDPPFRIFYRHNELWIESTGSRHLEAAVAQDAADKQQHFVRAA